MKQFFMLALLLSLAAPSFAEPAPSGGPLEVIEITMPDGTKQQGVISNGQFIPVNQKPAQPETAVQDPAAINAGVSVEQYPTQKQQVDQNIKQDIKSNNYNTVKREHDRVDTVNTYGRLLMDGIRMFRR